MLFWSYVPHRVQLKRVDSRMICISALHIEGYFDGSWCEEVELKRPRHFAPPPPREVEGRRRITLVFFSYLSSDFIQPCRGRSGERHASSFLVYFTLSRSIRLSAWHRQYSHLHNRRVTNERFLEGKNAHSSVRWSNLGYAIQRSENVSELRRLTNGKFEDSKRFRKSNHLSS